MLALRICVSYIMMKFKVLLPRGVTGNTSDSGSEESRFEPWRGNFFSHAGFAAIIAERVFSALSSKGSGRGPLKAEIRVRIPLGLQKHVTFHYLAEFSFKE